MNAQTAAIQITTDIPYPYRFTSSSILSLPSQITSSSVSNVNVTDSSCSTPNSDCTQFISFTISTVGICSFTGNYSISLTTGCESSFSPCPVTSSSNQNITFSLTSGNICGQLIVNSALTGTLSSYSDSGFSTSSLLFIAGQYGYFKASISSGVTIQSASLVNLNVFTPSQVTLRSSSSTTSLGNLANLTTTGFTYYPAANEVVFAFELLVGSNSSTSIFNNGGNIDQVFIFTVVADIDVTYKTTFGKRDIQTDSLKLSQKFVLDASNLQKVSSQETSFSSQPVSASSASVSFGILSLVLPVLFASFLSFIF